MIKNAFFPRFQFWYNFPHIFLSLLHISFVSFLYFSITYIFIYILSLHSLYFSFLSQFYFIFFTHLCVYLIFFFSAR